jgi:hypothetical protein
VKKRILVCDLFVAIGIFIGVFAGSAEAGTVDTLVLISQSGGRYDYAIQLAPNHGLVFTVNDQIILTGLSGVTGASVLAGLDFCFSTAITTAVSATIVSSSPCPVFDPVPTGVTIGAVRVVSTVFTTASINYQIQTGNEGTLSGTVAGPVAVVEPGAGVLAAVGLLTVLALRRTFSSSLGSLTLRD